jgi:hypothetical protein
MDGAGWAEAYRRAWEEADVEGAGALFTDAATYRVTPFDEPLQGRAAIEDYWRTVTSAQTERVIACTPLAAGEPEHVIHFRADLVVEGSPLVIDGVLAVTLDGEGRCSALREWWHADPSG